MEIITSKTNDKIVSAKKLLDKKERDKSDTFLAETEKVILEALKSKYIPNCFFVQIGKTYAFLANQTVPVYYVAENVLKTLSNVVTPDGIIAVFQKQHQKLGYNGGNFLLLDTLQNPDNFGAIMRTALASGFNQIFTINCVDEYSPKVLRASMGNIFNLNIQKINYEDIKTLFGDAKLYSCSMEGKNIFEIENFEQNCGFVIGNEGNGISEQLKHYKCETLAIPMENGVESLNASISASIIMYYIYSKNCKKH